MSWLLQVSDNHPSYPAVVKNCNIGLPFWPLVYLFNLMASYNRLATEGIKELACGSLLSAFFLSIAYLRLNFITSMCHFFGRFSIRNAATWSKLSSERSVVPIFFTCSAFQSEYSAYRYSNFYHLWYPAFGCSGEIVWLSLFQRLFGIRIFLIWILPVWIRRRCFHKKFLLNIAWSVIPRFIFSALRFFFFAVPTSTTTNRSTMMWGRFHLGTPIY